MATPLFIFSKSKEGLATWTIWGVPTPPRSTNPLLGAQPSPTKHIWCFVLCSRNTIELNLSVGPEKACMILQYCMILQDYRAVARHFETSGNAGIDSKVIYSSLRARLLSSWDEWRALTLNEHEWVRMIMNDYEWFVFIGCFKCRSPSSPCPWPGRGVSPWVPQECGKMEPAGRVCTVVIHLTSCHADMESWRSLHLVQASQLAQPLTFWQAISRHSCTILYILSLSNMDMT